jgi:hypothetical protein
MNIDLMGLNIYLMLMGGPDDPPTLLEDISPQ